MHIACEQGEEWGDQMGEEGEWEMFQGGGERGGLASCNEACVPTLTDCTNRVA